MRAKTSPATASSINNSRRERQVLLFSCSLSLSLFSLFLRGICQLSPPPPFPLCLSIYLSPSLSFSFSRLHRRLRTHARVQATSAARVVRATQTQPLYTRSLCFSLFLAHSFNTINLSVRHNDLVATCARK